MPYISLCQLSFPMKKFLININLFSLLYRYLYQNVKLPCGPGKPFFGHPNGCRSWSRRVYSCSIPNQGWWSVALSITSLQDFLLFVSTVTKNVYFVRYLGLLDMYASKMAKICVRETFWPVIQLINHLFKIQQKAFLPEFWDTHACNGLFELLKQTCLVTLMGINW